MQRDRQRQKLYDAERHAIAQLGDDLFKGDLTVAEVEAAFADLARRKRVIDHYPRAPRLAEVRIKDGGGSRRAAFKGVLYYYDDELGYRPTFRFPRWSRNQWVVLHEAAHYLVQSGESHGWQYAECLLWLWRQVRGVEAAKTLEASFKLHRVKYRKPRPKRELTPEQRAVLVERLAAARAAKAPAQPKPYRIIGGERVCATCPDGEYYWPCPEHAPELVSA